MPCSASMLNITMVSKMNKKRYHRLKALENHAKSKKKLLVIASILTILMSVPHFFVPLIFPWGQLIEGLYPPIQWALFALNLFFSILLLWGGFISLISALKWKMSNGMRYWIYGGLGFFWFVGAIYEIIIPFPLAEARWVLPGIALFICCLYLLSLLKTKK